MRYCLISVVALLFTPSASGLAVSADADAVGIATCSLTAVSSDTDPNGLNIRAGPGAKYAVIGRIPPPRTIGGDEFAGEVSITGSKDGWFRVKHAVMPDYIFDNDKDVFDGEGWVSGRYLYSSVEEQYLYSGPSTSKPVVADLSKPEPNGEFWRAGQFPGRTFLRLPRQLGRIGWHIFRNAPARLGLRDLLKPGDHLRRRAYTEPRLTGGSFP